MALWGDELSHSYVFQDQYMVDCFQPQWLTNVIDFSEYCIGVVARHGNWFPEQSDSTIIDWTHGHRDHSVHAPSQWETMLHCNIVSHWLGTCTEWIWRLNPQLVWHTLPWCHHDLETLYTLMALCEGNPPFISEFPLPRTSNMQH